MVPWCPAALLRSLERSVVGSAVSGPLLWLLSAKAENRLEDPRVVRAGQPRPSRR